jgi:hypothetical protein
MGGSANLYMIPRKTINEIRIQMAKPVLNESSELPARNNDIIMRPTV